MAEAPIDPIFALSSEFVDAYAKSSPIQASMAGVSGAFSGWDDLSPEGAEGTRKVLADYRSRIDALPPTTDRWAEHARQVGKSFLDEKLDYYDSFDHLSDLNNIECPAQHLRVVFDVMDTAVEGGWEALAIRLETLANPLRGYATALQQGAARDGRIARRQALAVLVQARSHASEKSSYRALAAGYREVPNHDPKLLARIEAGAENARAAFGEFASFLEGFVEKTSERDAFGRDRYLRSAKRFLGADIDPLETYAWGFEEVARIEKLMQQLAERISPGDDPRTVIAKLKQAPDQVVTDPDRFLALMRERQERALMELDGTHFHVPKEIRRLDIKLAPEGGALGAYYIPPSDGFSRPGTVFYAPGEVKTFTLFSEITTAYHEGFPGHHLQCGLQVYFADRLSRLHRLFMVCSGYAEGWALYAEELMNELGYFDKPEYVLGMLMAKLFRALRVVVDIGMHLGLKIPASFGFHPGETWNYALTAELLQSRGFIAKDFAESEATRYLGWPGQAISYKVGERVILDLRSELKQALGSRFELRAFHDSVLSTGSVGLELLQDFVRRDLLPKAG